MATMTAPAARVTSANPWTASIYAGLFTAIVAAAFAWFFQAGMLWLWIIVSLLIGVGPVLGYQLASGRLGSDWKSILGGILGSITMVLAFLLWPILVGALTRGQSIGKLLIWSIYGLLLGVTVFLLVGVISGQNPSWVGLGWVLAWSAWGGSVGAAMADAPRAN